MTLIKCCGMFRMQDIDAVNEAHPDFCGFVLNFPKSHRSVSADEARRLRDRLSPGISAVGVFVNEEPCTVGAIARRCRLDAVQLHGDEDEGYIAELKGLADVDIIQAFEVRTKSDLDAARASSADYVLLDNGKGTGRAFDWSMLADFERPYFLAGGLSPETIAEAIGKLHPYAVDLSSALETDNVKDPMKIQKAVRATRSAS